MTGYHSGYADVYCLLECAVVQFDRHFYSEQDQCVPSKPQFPSATPGGIQSSRQNCPI